MHGTSKKKYEDERKKMKLDSKNRQEQAQIEIGKLATRAFEEKDSHGRETPAIE